MSADVYLQIAGVFLTYSLKLMVGMAVCMFLARLSSLPDRRFRLWLGFMIAGGAYGFVLAVRVITELLRRQGGAQAVTAEAAGNVWLAPQNWKAALTLAMPLVFWIGVAVATVLVLATLWREVRLHLMLRLGRSPGENLARTFHAMCVQAGVECELLVVPGLGAPATVCWWNPRILAPEVCDEMTGSLMLKGVLRHELIHVQRRDYLWARVSDLMCCVLFFHPAVWKARAQMRVERELACDQAVISANPDARADYAESLTHFVRLAMLEDRAAAGIDFASPATFLGARIHAILQENQRAPWWKMIFRAASSVALLTAFALLWPVLVVGLRFAAPAPVHASIVVPKYHRTSSTISSRGAVAPRSASVAAVEESPATRLAPRWHPGSPASGDDLVDTEARSIASNATQTSNDSDWQERSPGVHNSRTPATVKGVLLQTAGVIVEERGEHPEHPAAHKRLPGH